MIQDGKLLEYYNPKKLVGTKIGGKTEADKAEQIAQAIARYLLDAGNTGVSMIQIGQHFGANREGAMDGWWVDTDTVLPTNEQAADFVGMIRHELAHALGISAETKFCDWNGNVIEDEAKAITYGTNK